MRKKLKLIAPAVILTGLMLFVATLPSFNRPAVAEPNAGRSNVGLKQVIVELSQADYVDPSEPDVVIDEQQDDITRAREKLYKQIENWPCYIEVVREYENFPLVALTVDEMCESYLEINLLVSHVIENRRYEPQAYDYSSPIATIGGSIENGFSDGINTYNGAGQAIVVIDTGVDKYHPALQGKVIAEACFGENVSGNVIYGDGETSVYYLKSLCPGGAEFSDAVDSALDCAYIMPGQCGHGTFVAAAAVMPYHIYHSSLSDRDFELRGVATETKIIAIQVASQYEDGHELQFALLNDSSILAALDYIATQDFPLPIAAVNMSFGSLSSEFNGGSCDNYDTVFTAAVSVLARRGIAMVAGAGNEGESLEWKNIVMSPACMENAIAVASVNNNGNRLSNYSSNGRAVDLLATGGGDMYYNDDEKNIHNGLVLPLATTEYYAEVVGTSFATPTVAGAFAILRQKDPDASVDELLAILQATGVPIFDDREGFYPTEKPLIQINAALAALNDKTVKRVSKVELDKTLASLDDLPKSVDFSATVYGLNNPSQAVTWSVAVDTPTGAVPVGTMIDSTGHVTISQSETAEKIIVIATSVEDPTKRAFAQIGEFVDPIVCDPAVDEECSGEGGTIPCGEECANTSIDIHPATATVEQGKTKQFTATVSGPDGPIAGATVGWGLAGHKSDSTTISNQGLLTVGVDETAETIYVITTFETSDGLPTTLATVTIVPAGSSSECDLTRLADWDNPVCQPTMSDVIILMNKMLEMAVNPGTGDEVITMFDIVILLQKVVLLVTDDINW
ncbi:S8 family serine peptidase [Candidatus Saccharibacteria bacterium]|nr:S8 family serine peptidase [Candidatus Saccharibacteria bacterium]